MSCDEVPYVEDLDLSQVCIPKLAKPSQNNTKIWTTGVHISPGNPVAPMGQTSFSMKIKYHVKPGGDNPGPTDNCNCTTIINPVHTKFIEQLGILDKVALQHFKDNRVHYWDDPTMTEREVEKKFVPLIKPDKKDGDLLFNQKLRPPTRLKNGNEVPRKNPTIAIEIFDDKDDAEEPTPITHLNPDPTPDNKTLSTQIESIVRFPCIFKTDGKCGINAHGEQLWFKRNVQKVYKRNRTRGKRKQPEQASPPAKRTAVEQEEAEQAAQPEEVQAQPAQATQAEDDDSVADDYDDVDDPDDYE